MRFLGILKKFHENSHYGKSSNHIKVFIRWIHEFTLFIIFLIFPQKWQFRLSKGNFWNFSEISQVIQYDSYLIIFSAKNLEQVHSVSHASISVIATVAILAVFMITNSQQLHQHQNQKTNGVMYAKKLLITCNVTWLVTVVAFNLIKARISTRLRFHFWNLTIAFRSFQSDQFQFRWSIITLSRWDSSLYR